MLYNNLFPEDREYILQLGQDAPTMGFQVSPEYSKSMALKLSQINYRAPWLAPDVQLALARGGASTAAIDQVGKMYMQRELDSYDQKKAAVGIVPRGVQYVYDAAGFVKRISGKTLQALVPGAAERFVGTGSDLAGSLGQVATETLKTKWASRWSLAALMALPEYANTAIGQVVTGKGLDIPGMLHASTFQTMLDNPELQGEGWLPNRQIVEEQAARSRAVRGTVYGSAWTVGRGVMATGGIFKEEDAAYRYGSGIIDALFNVILPEPSKYISKGLKLGAYGLTAARTGEAIETLMKAGKPIAGLKGLVPMLSEVDAASLRKALGPTKQRYLRESGLGMDMSGATYNALQFDKFFQYVFLIAAFPNSAANTSLSQVSPLFNCLSSSSGTKVCEVNARNACPVLLAHYGMNVINRVSELIDTTSCHTNLGVHHVTHHISASCQRCQLPYPLLHHFCKRQSQTLFSSQGWATNLTGHCCHLVSEFVNPFLGVKSRLTLVLFEPEDFIFQFIK